MLKVIDRKPSCDLIGSWHSIKVISPVALRHIDTRYFLDQDIQPNDIPWLLITGSYHGAIWFNDGKGYISKFVDKEFLINDDKMIEVEISEVGPRYYKSTKPYFKWHGHHNFVYAWINNGCVIYYLKDEVREAVAKCYA
jgi:hypothetical protein